MEKTLQALLENMDISEIQGDGATMVRGLAYNSRKVRKGDLFVAVRGVKQDGHLFVEDAVARGAVAVVVEELPSVSLPVTKVIVPNSRRALGLMAAGFYEHPSRKLCLIGVTGTNGKTTTTHLLEGILKEAGHKVGVIGTLAYRWDGRQKSASMTTPESLDLQQLLAEMLQDGVTHVVMEVSSHALALGRVDSCLFKAGVFTNLSQDHLDFHETMEEYFAAKALLFKEILPAGGDDFVAVVNGDDPFGHRLEESAETGFWSYGIFDGASTVRASNVRLDGTGAHADLIGPHGVLPIFSPLVGRLNLYNTLCAATTALALGVSPAHVAAGIASVSQVDGRLQRVPVPDDKGYAVIVDYAHTPDAMEKTMECLREMTQGRLWIVFGCGGDRDRAKRPIMGQIAATGGDVVVLTSDNPRSEAPEAILRDIEEGVRSIAIPLLGAESLPQTQRGYIVRGDRREAIELALSCAAPGDVVLIAGKGHETYQLVGDRVLHFDDREVVREFFEACDRASS